MRLLILLFLVSTSLYSQELITISGRVLKEQTGEPLVGALVNIVGTNTKTETGIDGTFSIAVALKGNQALNISASFFSDQLLPLILENDDLDLGTIQLTNTITIEQTDNLITLTEADLLEDDALASSSVGLLQATRDIFLSRAAFDFGQAFFRVRGYDSREGEILINGIKLNKFFDGRPQWNNWGGLNDVIRNQEFTNGLAISNYTFGGVLGNTNIDVRPSKQRPGTRLSTAASNRTYNGRVMATYNSGVQGSGLSYTLSASRRWANEGYINGTLYDAYSFFGALEYQISESNIISFTSILAKNRRGRSSAITEEVFDLVGNRYNPYWGSQNGRIRNSRERTIFEPIFMLNHYLKKDNLTINSGISYQFGTNARSRLSFFNAPNPDPTFFRFLPSFYINNPIGADFTNAALAREGFLANPQINWTNIFTANTNSRTGGKAAYVLHDDTANDTQISINSSADLKINQHSRINFGVAYQKLRSKNFAEIQDLVGAQFHEDIDPFSGTQNDLLGNLNKFEGDIFGYHYNMDVSSYNGFAQFILEYDKWSGSLSGNVSNTSYQRDGLFQNGRFLETSLGKSEQVNFSNFGIKGGVGYTLSARHWFKMHAAFLTRAPLLQNAFINPRENNNLVTNLQSETVSTVDLNYYARLPNLTARLSGFYTRFQNTTDVNFFFVNSGVGSDFVQEVITDLDRLHMGLELGVEYQLSSQVKLTAVANLANYVFANNPDVTINFDTAGAEEDLIDPKGFIELGEANIKGLKLAQGPQRAFAIGVEYRDPKYWWIGATANHLANNYVNISTITRTQSFFLDPDTGEEFPQATAENVAELLEQSKLDDFYLLNMVGGKSWLIDGKYISAFISINNVFDTVFRTGGFEQSRNGNFGQLQQDSLRDNPSFAPKFWYGFGRTYFLNLAISF